MDFNKYDGKDPIDPLTEILKKLFSGIENDLDGLEITEITISPLTEIIPSIKKLNKNKNDSNLIKKYEVGNGPKKDKIDFVSVESYLNALVLNQSLIIDYMKMLNEKVDELLFMLDEFMDK